jgi:hypothetical protein
MDKRRTEMVSAVGSPMATLDWSDPRIFHHRRLLLSTESRNPWDELATPPRAWHKDTKREEKRETRPLGVDKQASSTHISGTRGEKYGMYGLTFLPPPAQKSKSTEPKTKKKKKKSKKKRVTQAVQSIPESKLDDEAELDHQAEPDDKSPHPDIFDTSLDKTHEADLQNNLLLPETTTQPVNNTSAAEHQNELRLPVPITRCIGVGKDVLCLETHSSLHLPTLPLVDTPTVAAAQPIEDATPVDNTPAAKHKSRLPLPETILPSVDNTPLVDDTPTAELRQESPRPANPQDAKTETIAFVGRETPESSIRRPKQNAETTEEQAKSLRNQLEKKERDLKSAKTQMAAAARTELDKVKRKHTEDLEKLRKELSGNVQQLEAQHKLEHDKFQAERNQIEAEREKDTIDLRNLRHVYQKLRDELKSSQKSLDTETSKYTNIKLEAECLRTEKNKQSLQIGLLKTEVREGATKERELEERLAAAEEKCTQRHQKMSKYSADNIKLRDEVFLAHSRGFLPTQDTESGTVEYWRRKYNKLRLREEAAQADIIDLKSDKEGLEKEIIRLRGTIEESCTQLSEATRENVELGEKSSQLRTKVSELEMEVSALKEDREIKAPLIQLAVDIRLRYLEFARETALKITRTDADRVVIINGNTAAHRANGALDAAIFKTGLVPDCYLAVASHIFEHLYLASPAEYRLLGWTSKIQRIQNCTATLKSLKPVNTFKQSEPEREEYEKILKTLVALVGPMSGEEIESNEEIHHLVQMMEYLTDRIVERDRSKILLRRPANVPRGDTSESSRSGFVPMGLDGKTG